jgi:hypothetical protein
MLQKIAWFHPNNPQSIIFFTMKNIYRVHAIERMFERKIDINDIQAALENGETIENYVDETGYPGRLILIRRGNRALHVVTAYDVSEDENIIITGYRPDLEHWAKDFKRRRNDLFDV